MLGVIIAKSGEIQGTLETVKKTDTYEVRMKTDVWTFECDRRVVRCYGIYRKKAKISMYIPKKSVTMLFHSVFLYL